ncbi:acyltransferase family protein [Aldersonia kunmingensis]|uniref:acyltransferase family protein n=1 Tax=Aldersonia kunmingensis TaxID=408066 RepID=UPI000829AABE|nr:acyltransferase [Aldersonia kunmingensis]
MRLGGVDLLRTIAVFAVLYSHISYYFIDDLHSPWWLLDVVNKGLIEGFKLNNHLSFVGVAFFMILTGLLITGSVTRHSTTHFLGNRIGRLLPLLWVSVAAAILLVKLHINGMFSPQDGIGTVDAALSFVLGGFFLKPEVAVLGVTWTLTVQILFYLYCVAARPLLRVLPGMVPLVGAALCSAALAYNALVPEAATVPMLSKIAATMPAIFVGQIIYFAWNGIVSWPWLAAAIAAQVGVVELATETHAYWAGERYLWTIVVVTVTVLVLAKSRGAIASSPVVHWVGTRSYAIYLLHTLILYRVFELCVGWLGTTGAITAFLVVTAAASELAYRAVELPANRWISARLKTREQRDRA